MFPWSSAGVSPGPVGSCAGVAAAAQQRAVSDAQTREPVALPHGTLDVSDIKGTTPARAFWGPRSAPQAPADPTMHPKRFIRHRQGQDLLLNVADIAGTRPNGHIGSLPPRAQPVNPLDPHYLLPSGPHMEPPPLPKFIRDNLNVTDIASHKPATRTGRSLPSTMTASDIEGASAGWRPRTLFADQARDLMRVDDVGGTPAGTRTRGMQLSAAGSPESLHQGSMSLQGSTSPQGGSQVAGAGWPHVAVPDVGISLTLDWHRQMHQAKLRQAEAARDSRQVADEAIAAAATKAAASRRQPNAAAAAANGSPGIGASVAEASSGKLAGLLESLKMHDRDMSGRVQAGEFAAVLQSSGLGLSQGEVHQLVCSVQDNRHNLVEYRPFVSKLWGKMQAAGSDGSQGQAAGQGSQHSSSGQAAGLPCQPVPQFIAARQRRLQTSVAVSLGQQPEVLVQEAAEVARLPGFQPWKEPLRKQFGKRMAAAAHPSEFQRSYSFGGTDPHAAEEAAKQWKLSKDYLSVWAAIRPRTTLTGSSNAVPLPPTSASGQAKNAMRHQRQQQQQPRIMTPAAEGLAPSSSAGAAVEQKAHGLPLGSRGASDITCFVRGNSPLLAAERAAQMAAQQDVALIRSLD